MKKNDFVGKSKQKSKRVTYNLRLTSRKIFVAFLAFVIGNLFFAYIALLAINSTLSLLFFNPVVVFTSVILAVATYFVLSFVEE